MRAIRQATLAALLVVGVASGAQAQMMSTPPDTKTNATAAGMTYTGDSKWTFMVAPYFLFPHMDGTLGIKGNSIDVQADPGDIFDKLDFGFMLFSQARKGPWAFALDILYMDLGEDGQTLTGTYDATARQRGYLFEAYRRVTPRLEAMAGAMVTSVDANLQTTGPLSFDETRSKTWTDPMVGGRVELLKKSKWRISLTGAVGGFGVASDFAWQVYPIVTYTPTTVDLGFGYRAGGIDYKSGSGSNEFVYDIVTFGPELGLGFHF